MCPTENQLAKFLKSWVGDSSRQWVPAPASPPNPNPKRPAKSLRTCFRKIFTQIRASKTLQGMYYVLYDVYIAMFDELVM